MHTNGGIQVAIEIDLGIRVLLEIFFLERSVLARLIILILHRRLTPNP